MDTVKNKKRKNKKAIFCIHGFITDYTDFDALKPFFEENYRHVHFFNVPGHYPADFKLFDGDKTFELLLEEFDGLKKKYREVDVIGFSMGGALASYLACVRKIHKLILISPANKYLNSGYSFRWTAFYLRRMFENLSSCNYDLAKASALSKSELAKYFGDNKSAVSIMFTKILPNYSPSTLLTFAKVIKKCNKGLRKNYSPCLILYGELDELVPLSSVEYLKEYFLNAKVIIYDDVGHLMIRSSKAEKIAQDIFLFIS
jgi:esterase/lipase